MCERVYFDTQVFRAMGCTFEEDTLADELKAKILISPLSVFEVWSQLTVQRGDEVLRQLQSITNWTNAQRTGLLPWPDDALAELWYQTPSPEDGFTKRMENAMNACLASESVKSLQEEMGKLKDLMDEGKFQAARNFGRLLDAARREPFDFTTNWFAGIANRINADPGSRIVADIMTALSAYHEYEEAKLQTHCKIEITTRCNIRMT